MAENKSETPIASAVGDLYSKGRRKLLIVLCVIAVALIGLIIAMAVAFDDVVETREVVPLLAIVGGVVSVVVFANSPKARKLTSTAIMVYDGHVFAKPSGMADAVRIEYSQIQAIKAQGARRLQLRLSPPHRKVVVFLFNDKNAQYFASLLEEKQRAALRK